MPKVDKPKTRPMTMRRVKTVDDILCRSEVNTTLESFNQKKVDVTELLIIYKTSDGDLHYTHSGLDYPKQLWMLKLVETEILNPEE